MKVGKPLTLLFLLGGAIRASFSQAELKPAPAGFDSIRQDITRGKVEIVEYDSKTVGNKRKAIIYTPPGYSQDNKYNEDRLLNISERTHNYLAQHNVPHLYYLELGKHDFAVWKNDLYLFSQLIFR